MKKTARQLLTFFVNNLLFHIPEYIKSWDRKMKACPSCLTVNSIVLLKEEIIREIISVFLENIVTQELLSRIGEIFQKSKVIVCDSSIIEGSNNELIQIENAKIIYGLMNVRTNCIRQCISRQSLSINEAYRVNYLLDKDIHPSMELVSAYLKYPSFRIESNNFLTIRRMKIHAEIIYQHLFHKSLTVNRECYGMLECWRILKSDKSLKIIQIPHFLARIHGDPSGLKRIDSPFIELVFSEKDSGKIDKYYYHKYVSLVYSDFDIYKSEYNFISLLMKY